MSQSVVITGMHRSGTSLLASALGRAGVDLGSQLLPAGRGNRHGHFEDAELVGFHDRFLTSRGVSALAPPPDWQPRASPAEEAAAREMVVRREALPLWGFKDPRSTLFLDFWRPLLPAPLFLLVYRHPVEVALSLLRRGIDLEVQLDPWTAFRAWSVYNARVLAFRRAHPGSCRLWNVAATAGHLDVAVGSLGAVLGLPLAGKGVQSLFAPADLRSGLWATEIRWRAILPEALDLYDELEAAADLPAGEALAPSYQPSPAERELLETNEHLLAVALQARARGAAVETSATLRIIYSDLRRFANQREEESQHLRRRLQTLEDDWGRMESTRALRLVHRYWSATAAVRTWGRRLRWGLSRLAAGGSALRPEDCLIGCVVENRPDLLAQAGRLVRSIRWFGGGLARSRVWVCAVEGIDPEARRDLEAFGAEVRIVPRFDRRNPLANRLQFLEAALGEEAALLLLLDCDTLVVQDPLPLLRRGAFQAKIADVPSISLATFELLFHHFGLRLPAPCYRTTLLPTPTIRYCNAGVIGLPTGLARDLFPAWRDYNSRLLDLPELLGALAHHSHQASLALALAACPVPFREASPALNFPLHLKQLAPSPELLAIDPVILHYHDEVDAGGYLLPTPYPLAQGRVEAFNRRLRELRESA